MLDLDGDGLEFVNRAESQAKFDLTGNHFATQTAWLKGDDGFLALDQNNDGVINDINELFGNASQGGFSELSAFDDNADGRIDAQDSIYSRLKVWQDISGDGISQAEELLSLADLDIQSISLEKTDLTNPITDAQLVAESTFSRSDGTTGKVGEVLFATDPTYSSYVGPVEINQEIAALPNIKGYGQMADLHVAMALDPTLKGLVSQTVTNLDNQNFLASFEQTLYQWAGATGITLDQIDPNALLAANNGTVTFARAGVTLTLEQLGVIKAYSGQDVLRIGDGQWTTDGITQTTGAHYQQAWDSLYRNLLVKYAVATGLLDNFLPGLSYDSASDLISVGVDTKAGATQVHGNPFLSLFDADNQVAVTKALLAELTLQEIDPSASQSFKSLFKTFIGVGFADKFSHLYENPLFKMLAVAKTGTAGGESIDGGSGDDILIALAGNDVIRGRAGNDTVDGGDGDDQLYGDDGNDNLLGQVGADALYGGNGDDRLQGGEGNDSLHGDDGSDALLGQEGADTLHGGNGDDTLLGGEGNDSLYGEYGNDVLDGGAGNDYLCGGDYYNTGADRYLFGIGSGQDTIYDRNWASGQDDTVEFGAGISAEDLELIKEDSHLRIAIKSASDSLRINRWFDSPDYKIEKFQFADGSVLSASQLEARGIQVRGTAANETLTGSSITAAPETLLGGGGDDTLYGYSGNDVLEGETGNDRLYGGNDQDTLLGGEGNDSLYGEYGNDVLDGGAGNDYLCGGDYYNTGADRYLFGIGSGQDTIYDRNWASGQDDTVGISTDSKNLVFRQLGSDLQVSIAGQQDSVKIQNWYSSADYQIEIFETADGRMLANTQVEQLIQAMASFTNQTGLTWEQALAERPDDVQTVLAAHWQPAV